PKADQSLERQPECLSYPCNASALDERGLFLWRAVSVYSGMADRNQPPELVSQARSPRPWFDVPHRSRINNDFKMVLRQRSQDIKTNAVISGTQLVHICKKEINRIRSFHPARTNYFGSALATRICGNKMSRT